MALPNHLVVVCGHAIWLGGPKHGFDESEWLIESYKSGETPTFIEHIKAGIKILQEDERAVVMFSGGPTRKETPFSEARSYANLAAANNYFGYLGERRTYLPPPLPSSSANLLSSTPTSFHPRVMTEERALDSYYNILFSLIQFWRNHDCAVWPRYLTIVSHGFKRARLVDSHCSAIAFPLHRVNFVGINPPNLPQDLLAADRVTSGGAVSEEKATAMKGVRLVVGQWQEDPHGVGDDLAGKRRSRNPWNVNQMLFEDEDERQRSGVSTRKFGGNMECLVNGVPPPWSLGD